MLDGTILSVKQTGDLKFSRESKISLQISWRTESESGYVWTWKFLNPERKICGFKKYPDTSERGLKVPSHCHLDKVWERHSCDNGKEICQKVRCTFRFFFLFISQTCCMLFLFSRYLRRHRGCSSSPVALQSKTTIDMRRFRWKADDLIGKGRRKRRLQLLANREARIWKQLNLLSWMLATILTKYCGSFAFKNPPSELELCV